jgi:hypothetical protein
MSFIKSHALRFEHVGSRVTCNPAPIDTDDDWLVLLSESDDFHKTQGILEANGFKLGGSEPVETEIAADKKFLSFSDDKINLIITFSPKFFDRFMRATRLATRFNLMKKPDRIALFQAILYENDVADSDAEFDCDMQPDDPHHHSDIY